MHLSTTRTILFLIVIVLVACTPERKIARKEALNAKNKSVLVLLPTDLWLVNQKSDSETGSFTFKQAAEDPRLIENTLILSKLDRDEVIERFADSYLLELRKYGLKVFTEDQTEAFMQVDSNASVLNLAQIELQEFYRLIEDEVQVGETIYTYDFTINGFNLGLWLELSEVNNTRQTKPTVLFATHDLYDNFEGYFTMRFLTGKVDYKLKVDTLTLEKVYNFINYLGRLYAAYTFDYLINNKVIQKLSPAMAPRRYFRWDPYNRRLRATADDRFVVLDN